MSYRTYEDYKPSGHPWVKQIPSHWQFKQLKYLANCFPSNVDKKTKEGERAVLLCNYTDVYYNEEITSALAFMSASATDEQVKKFALMMDDVIITKDSEDPNDIAVPTVVKENLEGVICGYHLTMVRASKGNSGRFLKRVFDSKYARSVFATTCNGLTRYGLGAYAIDNALFPQPPLDEQSQIATFLDHETTIIDTLIDKQQQLIELLKEKRQAVISHAVTKGLNPDAKMKDSGVEWLGEVPEHWLVSQLKFKTKQMQTGPFGSQLHAEDYVDNGIPLINPAHIINGCLVPNPRSSVDQETQTRLARHMLTKGDLILARRGELGRCAVVRKSHEGWLCGTGSLRATLSRELVPDYAFMLISSNGVKVELSLESKGSTMENLNTETLGRIRLPIPPIQEQDAILKHVEIICSKFDQIESLAVQQVTFLKERRTALISAAVTGKIDVRNAA